MNSIFLTIMKEMLEMLLNWCGPAFGGGHCSVIKPNIQTEYVWPGF